ncbi:Spy/CpxP family protein refolding chaperone [Halomonas sp. M20]|uniref:Spy/CpxP family protein refolding chaperone n=1 Tax=Halomonas sp. M20 TaxID=2763264 RepID=UPI001D0A4B6D|nr:Spy/CpxP family protein refolding chaperone [Halomonas sp. M20]
MKNMSRSKLVLPLAIAASLSMSTLALAGPGDDGSQGKRFHKGEHHGMQHAPHGKERQHRFEHMAERLNLSEDQRDSLRDIFAKQREDRHEQRQQMKDRDRTQLFSGDPSSSDYKAKVENAASQAADSARQRVQARADHYAAIYEVLDDEQRDIWAKMQAERVERNAEHQKRMEQREDGDRRH